MDMHPIKFFICLVGMFLVIVACLYFRQNNDIDGLREYRKLDGREYSEHDIPYSIVIIDGKRFIVTESSHGFYQLTGPIDNGVAEKE